MALNHLPKINVSVVPHKKQRYPTAGDYFLKGGEACFRISKMHANHEFLVLLHELVEWYLITQKGISIEAIDAFDIAFENKRVKGNLEDRKSVV